MKEKKEYWEKWMNELLSCPLFENMQKAEILAFLEAARPQIKYFKKGQQIFNAGQQITAFGIFLNSEPRKKTTKCIEKWRSPNYYHPGWLFAELPAFSDANRIPFDVFAQVNCHIMFVEADTLFKASMDVNMINHIQRNMIGILARKGRVLKRCRVFYERKDLANGLYELLLKDKVINKSNNFHVPFSNEELAEVLMCTEEELICAYKKLEEEGLIVVNHLQKVELKDI